MLKNILLGLSLPLGSLATMYGITKVMDGYREGTVVKDYKEKLEHQRKCTELRGEFFGECQQAATRQQCEALYGQTRGHLFDGPPHLPFAKELDCSGVTSED